MRLKTSVVVGTLATLLSFPAAAEFINGNKLKSYLENYDSSKTGPEGFMGLGYVAAVYDANSKIVFCTPPTATLGQLASTVLKYLKDNPTLLHLSGDTLINAALITAWPCPTPQNNSQKSVTPPARAPAPKKPAANKDVSPF